MIDSGKLKGGVIVVLLLAVLAVFDWYGSYGNNLIGGAVIYDVGGGNKNCLQDLAYYPCSPVLEEGKSGTYLLKGKFYEVTADFVGSTTAKLTVNGEITTGLVVGESYSLADGSSIRVDKIEVENIAGGYRKVTFTLSTIDQTACTDSDGGKEYYVKGTTVGLAFGDVMTTRIDSCWPNNQYGDGYDHVAEWFCSTDQNNGKAYAINTNEKCPNGCKDGACLPSSPTDQTAPDVKDVLSEGETKVYTISGEDYKVTADSVGSTDVVFSVNGELTYMKEEQPDGTFKNRGLMVGEMYGLTVHGLATGGQTGGEIAIRVDKIETQDFAGGYRKVTFTIFTTTGATGQTTSAPSTNSLTLKANSFAAISLGAAFGSYYDANKATCKPDDIFLASWVYAPYTVTDQETGEARETPYQNILLFGIDANNKLVVKQKGHGEDVNKLKNSEKGLATFNWTEGAGAWVLNNGPECTLGLTYNQKQQDLTASSIELAKGTNFVSVTPQMISRTMEQVKGNCEFIGAFSNFGHTVGSAPDATPIQDWDFWTTQHTFTQNELGLGMWLYSDNTCKLSYR